VAVTPFRNRLYLIARDSGTGSLVITSAADLQRWDPWKPLPASSLAPSSPLPRPGWEIACTGSGSPTPRKPPQSSVVVSNSPQDGVTRTGWAVVEGGARPEGMPQTDQPADVAASLFDGRLYITSRWQPTSTGAAYVAVNFSSDGLNWSGWRQPQTTESYRPGTAPAIAGVGNHLYILAADADSPAPAQVSVH